MAGSLGQEGVPVVVEVTGGKTLLAGDFESGEDAVVGTIVTGSFPREMEVSSDGRTQFLTNAASNSLQII